MKLITSISCSSCAVLLTLTLFPVAGSMSSGQTHDSSLVGVWFTMFYNRGPHMDPRMDSTVQWYTPRRDSLKTPVVGWGADTLVGEYSSLDGSVLRRQISAMKHAGMDFIIADMTNGLHPIEPSYPQYAGDGLSTAALHTLFTVMNSLPEQDRLPIAVALGFEFWGRHSLCNYWRYWDGWDNQYSRQAHAITLLRKYFHTPSYFHYEGKPLVLAYMDFGLDYPPHNDDGSARNEWNHPSVRLRTVVAWRSTYTTPRTVGDGTCVESSSMLVPGVDSMKYWSWGQGAEDTQDGWDPRPLPVKTEEMAIMPGTHLWMFEGDPEPIKRRRGNEEYYIRSWKQVIKAKPRIVTICDWNNWNEETAIEGCVGKNGWTDLRGRPTYDWYLKITKAYAAIFKGVLPAGTFVKQDGYKKVYKWNGTCLEEFASNYKPVGRPIIQLPTSWLQQHKFWIRCNK